MFKIEKNDYSSNFTLLECLITHQREMDKEQIEKNFNYIFCPPTTVNIDANIKSSDSALSTPPLSPKASLDAKPPPLPSRQKMIPSSDHNLKNQCFSIDNILSPQECVNIINHTEKTGLFCPALINIGSGQEIFDPEFRNSQRCIIDDLHFAKQLFERILPYLPYTTMTHSGRKYEVKGLNERFRVLKYEKDHSFPWHRDGNFMRNTKEQSFQTVMIYLNNGGNEDYSGGSTLFETYYHNDKKTIVEYVPKVGGVVIFNHRIPHEGERVHKGIKYAIRTDLMYQVVDEE